MPSLIPLDDYLGAILIGLLLSTVLYGVTCLQTYLYYTRYSKGDGRGLKALVIFPYAWVSNSCLSSLSLTGCYYLVSTRRRTCCNMKNNRSVQPPLSFSVVDTFHVILLTISYYHYTVTNFGDYIALENDVWSLSVQVGVGALAGFLVQLFFAYRIYGCTCLPPFGHMFR
ncbi:uncharacterized protein B0H18DRAFT_937814 [Fomitopsis serialis]|uniref:uncharacterized protein n=1 Tax=Fomitopsis serialis TaxID=139415 RepID=UPI0020086BA3|nr:uncharacterized protein B0H18DRAFT_937814 [Neoantrodia serialis]KAH9918465.1 hypothetical protein B0H18DRAFT_937814 [Neoantrodia serialis]